MRIKQIINNNFVVVGEDTEMIVLGKGVGFSRRVGDIIEDNEITRIFYSSDLDSYNRLRELLINVPSKVVELSSNIVTYIKAEIGKEVNDVLYVTLIDHINSSITRHHQGINIKNSLLYEIQQYYPIEFELGKKALKAINKEFKISLIEDEAAFIALHIVNATMNESENVQGTQITEFIKEILSLVSRYYNITFDTESVYYYRFITHVRFLGQRIFTEYKMKSSNDHDSLINIVLEKYPVAYDCVQKIVIFLNKQYGTEIGNEEVLYLIIHVQRLVEESEKN